MIAGYYVADYFLLQHSALASAPLRFSPGGPRLWEVGVFFSTVGAFTFGGGLSILAFMQEQVVNQLGWLTPKEFIDGLGVWSQALMVHYFLRHGGMHFGPSSSWQRHDDRGNPSSDI